MQFDWLKPITFPNHDQIHEDESGPGYVLRMCDANLVQFSDISNLLGLTGFTYIPDNRIPEICRLFGASYPRLSSLATHNQLTLFGTSTSCAKTLTY